MSLQRTASRWRTQAQILLWRHGHAWLLAGVAALAALALWQWLLRPARAELVQLQAEWAYASAASRMAHPAPAAPPVSAVPQIQALQQSSPPAHERLRAMAALAQAEQISLAQADYHAQQHAATQLVQVQVTQPVRAAYPELRRYVEAVLRTMPNVTLDQVAAKRESVGQSQLDVRLRWSIWLPANAPALPARGEVAVSPGGATP